MGTSISAKRVYTFPEERRKKKKEREEEMKEIGGEGEMLEY
jgi:hypothetical protein